MAEDLSQIFESGRMCERAWSLLVEHGSSPEVIGRLTPYAATVREGSVARKNALVLLGAALGQCDHVNCELLISNGGGDTNQFGVVRYLEWVKRKDAKSLFDSLGAKPDVCSHGIALTERETSQVPHRMSRDVRSVAPEHGLRDLRYFERTELLSQMDLELPKSNHRRSMKSPRDQVSLVEDETTLEVGAGFRQIPHLQALPALRRLEHPKGPVLAVLLGGGDALVELLEGFIEAIERPQDPTAQYVRQTGPPRPPDRCDPA